MLAGSRKAKLRFEKAEFTEIERPSVAKHMASRGAAVTLTSKAHRAVSEYEDDNIGVQAVQETTKAVESTVYTVDHAVYSHKLKAYDKAEKLVEKSDKANVNALYEKFKKGQPLMPVPIPFPVGNRKGQSRKNMLPPKPVRIPLRQRLLHLRVQARQRAKQLREPRTSQKE